MFRIREVEMTQFHWTALAALFVSVTTLRGDIGFVDNGDCASVSNGLKVVETFFSALERDDIGTLCEITCRANGGTVERERLKPLLQQKAWFMCIDPGGQSKTRIPKLPEVYRTAQQRVSISMDECPGIEICLIPRALSVAFGHAPIRRLVFPIREDRTAGKFRILVEGIRRNEEYLASRLTSEGEKGVTGGQGGKPPE